MNTQNRKIKVGVIGTGSISNEHIRAYQKHPAVELAALCDIEETRVRDMGAKYGVKNLFTDPGRMLSSMPELDAVSICTWNSAHAPCAIAALRAGKHVLCEKPMAVTAAEAEAMRQTALENDRLLMIGFVRRFGNDCAILRDFIDVGYFGELYYAKAAYLRRNGCPGGWFGDKARSGGGPLIDLGVHVIDLVRYLFGNPRPVSVYGAAFRKLADRNHIKGPAGYVSAGRTGREISDVEDFASAMIRFDNGAVLSVETSFSLNLRQDENHIQLFGTKGGVRLDPQLEIFTEVNDYPANITLNLPTELNFSGLFENEIGHFIDCVRDGIPCQAPAEDGLMLMKILDAVYRSAAAGHEVTIE